jgi:hypothetical protein
VERKQNGDMTIFSVSLKDINIQKDSLLRIDVDLPEIEQHLNYELCYDDTVSTDKIQTNPLPFVFKLLTNANRNLPFYVNSENERQQVVGTTWLLSMLGLIHMNLGIVHSDDERLYNRNSTKGTADTIAFDKDIGILVIDFTNSPPKQEKIDKIRNSAKYINEKVI